MDESTKKNIAKKLTELSSDIVFRRQPFEKFKWPKGVGTDLLENYITYSSDISNDLNLKYRNYVARTSFEEFCYALSIPPKGGPFSKRFPELFQAAKDMDERYRGKTNPLNPYFIGGSDFPPSFDVNKIINETIRNRYPGVKLAKKKPVLGIRTYYLQLEDNKLFFGFERSNLRSFMSFFIGFENPWIMFDIACLFNCGQSYFDYVKENKYLGEVDGEQRMIFEQLKPTPSDLEEVVDSALDLMDYLVPHISNKLCLKLKYNKANSADAKNRAAD